ncbi:MAG TPA: glycosyltransferase family 39 protein [Candidatus Acidoferrum sp.]|nr:glycosyltransferase family 39 protein [Candidatus Acidoferrum sp.]
MSLQDIIHYIEVGAGKRYLRIILPCLLILGVAILRDFRTWKNFSAPEAMDSAQLARNIAEGKGYTTSFVRPLSIDLVQEKNQGKTASSWAGGGADFAQVKTAQPDLANPPVYPLMLAGWMKILPFHFDTALKGGFWSNNGSFYRYQPDFLIGLFNLLLFLATIPVTFQIAKKLFDAPVARLTAGLMIGCALLWRFTESGLSTMLLMLIFLGLAWCILKIEELAREQETDANWILCWAALAGILTGVGALTRYSFGWIIIPVALFLILFSGSRRLINALAAFVAFAVVFTPWVVRNVQVSGTPFGTAGFAIMAETPVNQGFPLERSLHPDLTEAIYPPYYGHKLLLNLGQIVDNDLFKLGGSWVSVLFFAGLLLGFNRPAVRRMRYFLLMSLTAFMVAQALGRTWLSDETPELNSENLIVLAVPLVFIFGSAFFFILLDQMDLPMREIRYFIIGVFVALCCLPLALSLWVRSVPIQYPPYYPPDIQKIAGWMRPNELTMSDVPWAVAWYGNRQSVWFTQDDHDDFYAINDYIKPVSGLYLSMNTMDGRLVTDCFRSGPNSWGAFVLEALSRNNTPKGFPLAHAPSGSAAISSGLFLTDADRWKIIKVTGP